MSRLHQTRTETLGRERLPTVAGRLLDDGWRLALVAAHDDPDQLRVVYCFLRPVGQRHELTVEVPRDDPWIPTLAHASFPARRFEREICDLYNIRPEDHPLPQRLVKHGHWPAGHYPMRHAAVRGRHRLLPVHPRRGRRRVRDPRGTHPRRAHRTRALPVLRGR